MIVHVVAFRMSAPDPASRVRDAVLFRERLLTLEGQVPGLISLEVGVDLGHIDDHADLVLTSKHTTYPDLEAYQLHPLHVEVSAFGRTVVEERTTVDYEVASTD